MTPVFRSHSREVIRTIKEITGYYPIVGLWNFREEAVKIQRKMMREQGIAEVYEIADGRSLSDTEQLQLLNLLHGCLREGDAMLANVQPPMNPRYSLLYERAKKEITEAKQKMTEEIRRRELVEDTLQQEMKKLKMKLEESSASREGLVDDNERLNNEIMLEKEKRENAEMAMTENDQMAKSSQERYKEREAKLEKELKTKKEYIKKQKEKYKEIEERQKCLVNKNEHLKGEMMREKEKREQAELAMVENDKMAQNSLETYKEREAKLEEELKTKEQRIQEQTEKHKVREETARREVEQIQKEKEEERGRAAQLKKEVESNQRRVNSFAELLKEKEQNEASLKRHVNCLKMKIEEELSVELALKNKLRSEKERVEQLERETWKLRTKIQLESEIRSEEKKKKVGTSQWSFIPRMSSGKQTQTGTSLSEDTSNRGSRGSDEMQAGKELPDDEFADILKQIADDLYDEAKIDSLGGQLGIIQGDIQRALMTNVKFNRVTSEGTRHMLKQWRRGVSREDERIELRRALEAAKLLDLAENYLPKELAVEASAPLSPEMRQRDGEEYDTATDMTEGTKVEATTVQSDKQDSQQHESVHHVGGVRDDQPSQSVISDISDGTESFGRLVVAESSAGKFHCSEVAVGSAAATSSSDNQNQDEVSDAPTSQTMAEHMEVQDVQEYLQKQDLNDCVLNSPDIFVADGQMEDEQHQASQAHDSTALLDESDVEESSSEGRCCFWCCLFSSSGQ